MLRQRLNLRYIAGVFDGDGTICLTRTRRLEVSLSQCNRVFLESVARSLGGGSIYTDARINKYRGEPNHVIKFTGHARDSMLRIIADHGIVKAPQAVLALDFLKNRDVPFREACGVQMREMNRDKTTYVKKYDRVCDEYVAGLFDAEGNVFISTKRPSRYVKITQYSDPLLLDHIRDMYGFGSCTEYGRYRISKKADIASFVDAILPHTQMKTDRLAEIRDVCRVNHDPRLQEAGHTGTLLNDDGTSLEVSTRRRVVK
jgi:hypothetical protein